MNKQGTPYSLGIIDYRNIVSTLKDFYMLDFSNYSFTAFKRQLEKVIGMHNMSNANDLVAKIRDEEKFVATFLHEISIEETEMFRDPGLWRELREIILPKIITGGECKIWVPDITSGEELFTLLIVLDEMKALDKVSVIATSICDLNIEAVKKGVYNMKKMEVNIANYKRYKGKYQFTKYYTVKNNDAYMDLSLLNKVEFKTLQIPDNKDINNVKLILYRDKMLYFNKRMESDYLQILYNSLHQAGYFIIGIKESLECCNAEKRFTLINSTESIYKKTFL